MYLTKTNKKSGKHSQRVIKEEEYKMKTYYFN